MRKFLIALFSLVSCAVNAQSLFYGQATASDNSSIAWTNTISFVATPAYTSYTVSMNSPVDVGNISNSTVWIAAGNPAIVIKDSSNNIISTTITYTTIPVTMPNNSSVWAWSAKTSALTSLTNGATYTITVSGTTYAYAGGHGVSPPYTVSLSAQ